jgi:hypothetical protein
MAGGSPRMAVLMSSMLVARVSAPASARSLALVGVLA